MDLRKKLYPGEIKPLSETRRQIFEKVRRRMVELGLENPFVSPSVDDRIPARPRLTASKSSNLNF